MQKDGEDGRKKITAITRYVTIFLAVIESLGLVIGFDRGHYMTVTGPLGYLLVIITLTTGSAFVMWLGERVTEKGVGNGISIILLINIVSRMPSDFSDLYTKFMKGQDIVDQVIAGAIIMAVILVTTILVVLLQGGACTEGTGKKNDGRTAESYSSEGQHIKRYPGYLRFFHSFRTNGCCEFV